MIPLDEDIVDMTNDSGKGDLNMREFTLDDDGDNSNDDGIDAKKNIKIESFSVGEEPYVVALNAGENCFAQIVPD